MRCQILWLRPRPHCRSLQRSPDPKLEFEEVRVGMGRGMKRKERGREEKEKEKGGKEREERKGGEGGEERGFNLAQGPAHDKAGSGVCPKHC